MAQLRMRQPIETLIDAFTDTTPALETTSSDGLRASGQSSDAALAMPALIAADAPLTIPPADTNSLLHRDVFLTTGNDTYFLSMFYSPSYAYTVYGFGGKDWITGYIGDDTIYGGDGNDTLEGGAGADVLSGGDGYDLAGYWNATAAVSIDLTRSSSSWFGDARGDVLTSIEEIQLTNFADTFFGADTANLVRGGTGDDTLIGGGANDTLFGDSGDDWLVGGNGKDWVDGGAGNDPFVKGGRGDDVLVGGLGGDFLVGDGDAGEGRGADIFRYTTVEESQNIFINGVLQQDRIVDFVQGEDKIDLSAIDANVTLAGDQAFTFIGDPSNHTGDDWTGVVAQMTWADGTTSIAVSTDADGDCEMLIYMSHPYQFTASDFIL